MTNFTMEDFSTQLENIVSTYTTDTIYILGKGPSADEVRSDVYAGSVVIGINDAERIIPTDISIFHAPWVSKALAETGCRSRLYISAYPFDAGDKPVVVAPHVALSQESSDLIMQRFMSEDIIIEDILFLSALKLARKIAELKGRKQTIYMVGFDFDAALGRSEQIGKDYSTEDDGAVRISVQEFYFLNALYFLRDSLLDVRHVGTKSFSALTARDLNETVAGAHPYMLQSGSVEVVAELTTNHFGDRRRLERMIRASKAAGANYVKLQKRDVESFYTVEQLKSRYVSPFGDTFGDYRRQLELTAEDFLFVDKLCAELGLGWFASILDEPSFKFMQALDPKLVKLPSTISEHKDYLKLVAQNYKGSVVLSTGMTDQAYEDFVVSNFKGCERLYLLQCNSAYPTPLHDCNIGVIRHYHELSKTDSRIIPGYSSHDFGSLASALAVASGAKMLEKHVKLGNTEWAHFDAVAVDLTTDAFRNYVADIREAEMIMGSESKKVNDSEHHKYRLTAQ